MTVPTAMVLPAGVDCSVNGVVSRWCTTMARWCGGTGRGADGDASSALADDAVVADGAVGARRAPKLCVNWWGVD
jgi:hypothetical protein